MMKTSCHDEFIMWRVNELWGTKAQISRAPREIRGKYEIWRSLIVFHGPDRVAKMDGFSPSSGFGLWEHTWFVALGFLWTLRCYTRPEIHEVLVLKLESGIEVWEAWEAELKRREART